MKLSAKDEVRLAGIHQAYVDKIRKMPLPETVKDAELVASVSLIARLAAAYEKAEDQPSQEWDLYKERT